MKKKYITLIALLVFLLGINNVSAITLKPSGTSIGTRGEEITLYLTLNRTSNEKEVSAVDGTFSYDSNILTLVESSVLMNNWTEFMPITNNKVFSYANLSFDNLITNTNQNIIKIIFKINNDAVFGNTVVAITNPSATDANGDGISIEGGSHTIKVLSNINTLTNIRIEGANIDFDEDTSSYDLNIDSASTTIEVTKKDNTSIVEGDTGTRTLNYGLNTFSITVTSESGSKRTYILNITRPDNRSSDNTLSSLEVNTVPLNFNKDVLNYDLTVENNTSTIEVSASLTDNKSSFVENYEPRTVDLNVGTNKIEIKVKAENEEIKTYTINITRKEKETLADDNITTNNSTGDSYIIIISIIGALALGFLIYYLVRKKQK